MNNETWRLAKLAYETLAQETNWTTYDGHQMFAWKDLSTRHQDAWGAVVATVRQEVGGTIDA